MSRVVEIALRLIQFPTLINDEEELDGDGGGKGNCFHYIGRVLEPYRGIVDPIYLNYGNNLVVRFKGRNSDHPLLLHGHIDTAFTTREGWDYHPLLGNIVHSLKHNCEVLCGLGALDMKGSVAVFITAIMEAIDNEGLESDVILCLTSDEEEDSLSGARWLVKYRRDLFKEVKHAIGELGGFPIYYDGHKFYTISVAEKVSCTAIINVPNVQKHPSIGKDTLSENLRHVMETVETYWNFDKMTKTTGNMIRKIFEDYIPDYYSSSTSRTLTDLINQPYFQDCFCNKNTLVRMEGWGSSSQPSEISLTYNCALLPGVNPEKYWRKLLEHIEKEYRIECELELLEYDNVIQPEHYELFSFLSEALIEQDPEAEPIPYLLPSFTDSTIYSKLGIQTYGFTPMKLPENFNIFEYIHAPNEQIPVESLEFGVKVIKKILTTYKAKQNES